MIWGPDLREQIEATFREARRAHRVAPTYDGPGEPLPVPIAEVARVAVSDEPIEVRAPRRARWVVVDAPRRRRRQR